MAARAARLGRHHGQRQPRRGGRPRLRAQVADPADQVGEHGHLGPRPRSRVPGATARRRLIRSGSPRVAVRIGRPAAPPRSPRSRTASIGCSRRSRSAQRLGGGEPGARPLPVGRAGTPQVDLGHLQEPVAVVAPGELVAPRRVARQVELVELAGGPLRRLRQARLPIQRSARVGSPSGAASGSGRDPSTKRAAFHSLFVKLRAPSSLAIGQPLVDPRGGARRPARSAGHRRRPRRSPRADRPRCPSSCSS